MTKKTAVVAIVGALILGCSILGTSPSDEKVKTFYKSKQYNQKTEKFENRRPGLIDKDREEFLSFSLIWDWFKGAKDATPKEKLPEEKVDLAEFLHGEETVKFIWLGHSSLLINFAGKIILVDPIFSSSASPVSFIGRRFQDPVIRLKELPKIDLILISHDHYDHLDMETVKFFKEKNITFVSSLGVGSHLEGWGVSKHKIIERDWMESFEYKSITFTAAPSQHFSGRGIIDGDKTLWSSWIIKSSKYSIYFSGDSGYDIHFKNIGEKYGPFDIAFIENGQYDVRFGSVHMLPEEVAIAYKELKAKKVFPIHWGMFDLSTHSWYEPPKRLLKAVENKEDVVSPRIGFLYDLSQLPNLKRWWNEYPRKENK